MTAAGERFLPRAQAMVATWKLARDEMRLPARFDRHLRIAAQYALWPDFLIPWIALLQSERPTLALTLEAGAAARLNRELAASLHDLAILYSPVLSAAVDGTEIVNDRLIMVRAADCDDWRENWVNIDWGEAMRAPIAEAVGYRDSGGVTLNLGGMALSWLMERRAAGYMPARLAREAIEAGTLVAVDELPAFDYPAFAVWPRKREAIVRGAVFSLREFIGSDDFLRTPVEAPATDAQPIPGVCLN